MEVTRDFLIDLGGYDVLKQARSMLDRGTVVSSDWQPPVLKGLVQEGPIAYRAGLVIKSARDVENLCTCYQSRHRSIFCAHSIAVGLHYLRSQAPTQPLVSTSTKPAEVTATSATPTRRLKRARDGVPAEIGIIFPPNFEQSIVKGKLTLYFEGQWQGNRAPLGSLPLNIPFLFSEPDLALLDTIEKLAGGNTPAMLMLNCKHLCEVFSKLIEHPRVTLGKSQKLSLSPDLWRVKLSACLDAKGEILIQKVSEPKPMLLIEGERSWVFDASVFHPLSLSSEFTGLLRSPLRIQRAQVPAFLSQKWAALQAQCEVVSDFKLEDFSFEPLVPSFALELTGGLARLEAVLRCSYGNQLLTVGAPSEALWMADPKILTRYSTRNLAAENAALLRLQKAGFSPTKPEGRFQLAGQNQVLLFVARDYPLLQKEWKVTLEERLDRSMKENLEVIQPEFAVSSSGEQWFDLDVSFQTKGGERFSAVEIQQLLLKGQSYMRLKNGRLGIFDTVAVEELQEVLVDCAPEQHAKGYRLSSAQIGFLDETIRQQNGWKSPEASVWRERVSKQRGEAKTDIPPLGALEDVLRSYQKLGVGWLAFLRENGFGGVLADEMGLGKTLQVLAHLSALKRASCLKNPSLIVCPTSLLFNWAAEVARFTPELKILLLHGASRHEHFGEISGVDLVVTSYGLIRRDAEKYRALEWDTLVLDEAQHIKNRQTQNAQAVKAVRAQHRLVLTGTPMENSVLDLWSIFDFLMPGYLGSSRDFKDRYEVPIAREKDPNVQSRLARRIRPFLLRRLKREVARDLPEKIEQVSFCELSDDQREIYQKVLDASRQKITESVGSQGLQKSRMMILTALLRLRQICCDLRLLKLEAGAAPTLVRDLRARDAAQDQVLSRDEATTKRRPPGVDLGEDARLESPSASGKLEMFGELLEQVLDGGHRVLVFSQFVSMLALLQEKLKASGVEYCYLDGSTTNRGEVVNRFQTESSISVFLISLKAGGVGLNLTGADTVIHFDPWWNPSVEDQATDRAHRIGQTRVVTSYKLIARGTVEEKILNLQAKKKSLIQSVLVGEDPMVEALDWEEIQDLFAAE